VQRGWRHERCPNLRPLVLKTERSGLTLPAAAAAAGNFAAHHYSNLRLLHLLCGRIQRLRAPGLACSHTPCLRMCGKEKKELIISGRHVDMVHTKKELEKLQVTMLALLTQALISRS